MASKPPPDQQQNLRRLPSVEALVDAVGAAVGDEQRSARRQIVAAARFVIDDARSAIRAGATAPALEDLVARARSLLKEGERPSLRRVINGTGVLIHTNLGRAPLGREQLDAVVEAARGYSNLEYDLTQGTRGSRYVHTRSALASLVGAEAAVVVNNNAGAVLLTLAALCAAGEVVVSRGELIEIGGEFRIPDIVDVAGVELVEVGTTNRTHLSDYERAISPRTRAILKVHPSNYRIVGFTAEVTAASIARLAREHGVSFVHDLGSGLIRLPGAVPASDDPSVERALADGSDVVTFSGDKLLGGPQAGVIAGRAALVDRIQRHPLARSLRPDKMTLAALGATLRMYEQGRELELPLLHMIATPLDELRRRATEIVEAVGAEAAARGAKVEVVATAATTGGGSLPGAEIDSCGLRIAHPSASAAELQRTLRRAPTPVVARVEDDRVVIDLRTVDAGDDAELVEILRDRLV